MLCGKWDPRHRVRRVPLAPTSGAGLGAGPLLPFDFCANLAPGILARGLRERSAARGRQSRCLRKGRTPGVGGRQVGFAGGGTSRQEATGGRGPNLATTLRSAEKPVVIPGAHG